MTWVVGAQPGAVGAGTLALLQAANGLENGNLGPNSRDLQLSNGRQMLRSFDG